jgi:hypothetical protein
VYLKATEMNKFLLILLSIITPYFLKAQVLPPSGSKLNYRMIGLSIPAEKGVSSYTFQISKGKHNNIDSFKKYTIVSLTSNSNAKMTEVPQFGAEYTWRVLKQGNQKSDTTFYHFSTEMNDRVDSTKYRLKILQPSEDYKDMFVSLDGGGVFYDFKGKPVAYIPEVNGLTGFVADMGFTDDSTITFNFGPNGREITLNGDILWKLPDYNIVNTSGDPDKYHHAFIKLSNGHYMTLGSEYVYSKVVSTPDTSYVLLSDSKTRPEGYSMGYYGTIIEFDKDGKVVWYWKDTKNLIGTDFDYYAANNPDSIQRFDPHCNSIFFDEKNGFVYMSYRNLNRIIKIDYKTRNIVAVYGENFKTGVPSKGSGYFCNPHGVRRSDKGYIYFFNNNSCKNTDSLPSIVILQEPENEQESLKKIWEFNCTVEGAYLKKFGAGGSVIELPDGSMYVCMGNHFTKMFIVTRNKKVTWSALPERHIETDNIWFPVKQYKTNIINRQDLEKLIWLAEKKTVIAKQKK